MNLFRADLHCHTTFSDGTSTPEQLIAQAKEIGLQGLCITDHDTVGAYPAAFRTAKEAGILLGVGAEFSCVHQGNSVHVLAYDFDYTHPEIQKLCARHEERRKLRNAAILERLSRFGMSIFASELERFSSRVIGRPHIAQLMVEKRYVSSIQEAFQRFLADDKPCYVAGVPISLEETLAIVKRSGGKNFIAHPHLIRKMGEIKRLLLLGFDGIECYYGRSSLEQNRRFIKLAEEKGLLKSGGSDFHGKVKEFVSLGSSWVDEVAFHQIFQRKQHE